MKIWLFALPLIALAALNAWVDDSGYDRFYEELPRAFASSKKGAHVGGTRDLLLTACGMRSMAADFAMVDTLIYYGTHQSHEHDDDYQHLREEGTGLYLDLYALTKRILILDPFFRYATLYGASALAFNEMREDQAIEILEDALHRDPSHWQYPLLLSSIAYKRAGNSEKIIESLEPLVASPDCPTMLKNILANFYLKVKKNRKAIRLLVDIYETAPEEYYRNLAYGKLTELEVLKP